ncbi:MAG: hypothetical protein AAFQ67_00975 [Pseudomonadota bacterium]
MNKSPKEQSADASAAVASLAGFWEPFVVGGFAIGLFLLVGDGVLQPIIWSLASDGWYPMPRALTHVRDNVAAALPGYALLWAFWEARIYLLRLRRGGVWLSSTQHVLSRIGWVLVFAGVLGATVRPILRLVRDGSINLGPDLSWLALAGVGVLVTLVGRITASVVEATAAVKRENEDFI